jgi:serine protease Do
VEDSDGEDSSQFPTPDDEEREREILEQLSDDRSIGRFEKRATEELKLYESVAGVSQQSVVAVRDNGLLLCLGTVMSSDGYILTKASELDGAIDPEIILPDGRRFRGKEMAADYSYDLMLLKVDAKDLKPAAFFTETLPAGTMALVQDPRGKALIPTVISVVAHTSESAKRAFLGITMPNPFENPNEPVGNGVRIVEVLAGGAAVRNGLKPNDRILSVDGYDVHDPESLKHRIGGFKPGDKVAIRFMREDSIRTIEIVLTSKFTNENALLPLYRDPELTGQFASTHAQGFPRALQIDADVYPTKVGGPLLDLNGQAIGIVIARADRFPTYAIPADAVKTVFEQLKAEAVNRKPEQPVAQ